MLTCSCVLSIGATVLRVRVWMSNMTGIIFWTSGGTEIVKFQKHHTGNCIAKHQSTNERFKRMVRVHMNMRNRMNDDGYIADGLAPSYVLS